MRMLLFFNNTFARLTAPQFRLKLPEIEAGSATYHFKLMAGVALISKHHGAHRQ